MPPTLHISCIANTVTPLDQERLMSRRGKNGQLCLGPKITDTACLGQKVCCRNLVCIGNPKIWVPYVNTKKDCSQEICTEYCPQWCSEVPPAPSVANGFKFSPMLVTILAAVVCVLLLVTYFAGISKYCRKKGSERRHNNNSDEEMQDALHQLPTVGGLDESFIKSIAVCVYKKDDGLVGEMDCAVCLGEFREDERLRILPKCGHAFHVHCIDLWLKSHSTCPLCRASLTCLYQ